MTSLETYGSLSNRYGVFHKILWPYLVIIDLSEYSRLFYFDRSLSDSAFFLILTFTLSVWETISALYFNSVCTTIRPGSWSWRASTVCNTFHQLCSWLYLTCFFINNVRCSSYIVACLFLSMWLYKVNISNARFFLRWFCNKVPKIRFW